MGFFKNVFGKNKTDWQAAQFLGLQAIQAVKTMLDKDEIAELFPKLEEFYSKSKMWPAGFKSFEELEIYLIVMAKYISIHIHDAFSNKFNTDELIKLSQSAMLVELSTILNSQKKNPNSDLVFHLSELLTKQKLAMQSSYIIASESVEMLKTEKIKILKSIELLANGKIMQVMQE